MPRIEDFVWRFKLDKTGLKPENTTDPKVRMVRQQIQNLLNLVFLFQDNRRLRPTFFSFIGDSKVYQIFEDEADHRNKPSLPGSKNILKETGTNCEENKGQADS